MKKVFFPLLALAALILALLGSPGCVYENEEDLYGTDTPCDTASMRYSVEILEILQDNCYECHLPTSSNYSEISFETYDDVKVLADNGKLVARINDASAPMPQSGLMLLCNRQKIEAWVRAGAPNN
jgi:hypothetical protein